jgi:hypothetical protein
MFDFAWFRRLLHRSPCDVVVLGTSNCIGPLSFVTKIAGMKEVLVRNLAVGASSSTTGLYMLDQIPPTKGGLGILDYWINDNDAAYNLWGETNARQVIAANLRTLGNRLRALGYLPILAILPAELAVDALLGERLHDAFCRQENLNFVNVRSMVRKALDAGADETALMRDNWHMSERANDLFAGFIGEFLDRLPTMPARKSRRVSSVLSSRMVAADRLFAQSALVERSSSLRSKYYGQLAKGAVINVPLAEDERIAALMVNAGAMGGTIAIRGRNAEAVKNLTFEWSNHKPEMFFSLLVDVAQPILGGQGGVTIEIIPDERMPTERTIHGRPAPPGRDGEVEIEGILVTSAIEAEFSFAATGYRGLPLDLGELPEGRRLFEALVGLRS